MNGMPGVVVVGGAGIVDAAAEQDLCCRHCNGCGDWDREEVSPARKVSLGCWSVLLANDEQRDGRYVYNLM